ncbi:MAG: hypothetical protein QM767_10725 [Anaeromyxobacter sp.]
MGFREHLEDVCRSCEGALAASLMGVDGIEVDSHQQGASDLDLKALLVECSGLVRNAREAAETHQAGGVSEFSLGTEKLVAVARLVTPEYFMILALSPDGNLGKARYLLRITAPKLRSEL